MKTKYDSFNSGGLPEGCKYCLRGEKLVLFMTGKCPRNCWYCSLSSTRKKCKNIYANERLVKNTKDLILEAEESNAKGAGITGGDPLVEYRKTKSYSQALKKRFGESFHIHIYLPLNLVDKNKIEQLSHSVDEFRFHPSFLINDNLELMNEEIEKIKMVCSVVGKDRMGLELPMMPNRQEIMHHFIEKVHKYISFVNLNEFELSETNFEIVTKNYTLNEDTYTIRTSLTQGKKLLKRLAKDKFDIKIHLCTARTKDAHQYVNRMKLHNILPYGKMTNVGTVVYYIVVPTISLETEEYIVSEITSRYCIDKEKKRIIVNKKDVRKLYMESDLKLARVEEHPCYNSNYLEIDYLN